MTTTESSASTAHPSTTETPPAYVLRSLGIFGLHRDELLESYQGGGCWLVPSGTEPGKVYEVRVGRRPERNRCECRGFASHGHCSHLVAARRAARTSAVCDGCGKRVRRRDLVEVGRPRVAHLVRRGRGLPPVRPWHRHPLRDAFIVPTTASGSPRGPPAPPER